MGEEGAARDDMVLEDEVMIVEPLEYVKIVNRLPTHGLEFWLGEERAWISEAYNQARQGRRKQSKPDDFTSSPSVPTLHTARIPYNPNPRLISRIQRKIRMREPKLIAFKKRITKMFHHMTDHPGNKSDI